MIKFAFTSISLCNLGIHKFGRKKQWINEQGNPVLAQRCTRCGKLKQ